VTNLRMLIASLLVAGVAISLCACASPPSRSIAEHLQQPIAPGERITTRGNVVSSAPPQLEMHRFNDLLTASGQIRPESAPKNFFYHLLRDPTGTIWIASQSRSAPSGQVQGSLFEIQHLPTGPLLPTVGFFELDGWKYVLPATVTGKRILVIY